MDDPDSDGYYCATSSLATKRKRMRMSQRLSHMRMQRLQVLTGANYEFIPGGSGDNNSVEFPDMGYVDGMFDGEEWKPAPQFHANTIGVMDDVFDWNELSLI
jgi:hypothetical protein